MPCSRRPWRDADPATYPDAPYAIRMKAPRTGETVIDDQVQGRVTIRNETLDDMIVLRSDGTPTYMLAVVVDDHDMGVTHVIRGDDHLNNAARQQMVYDAMGWEVPVWAHIPLIHGPDGKKLSKRHGATGVEEYQAMGYPAAGMRNYLTRLGWAHGDAEIFTSARGDEDVRPCRESVARRRGWISRSWKTPAAITWRWPTMLHCCMNCRLSWLRRGVRR